MLDCCFVDLTTEFLTVAFHNILYYSSVYPEGVFECRKKYSIVVHRCSHPEVNQYIDLCLRSIAECLKKGKLDRIDFSITDGTHKTVMKFVFTLEMNKVYDDTSDAYLIQCEQNLRAFCLHLSSLKAKFPKTSKDSSFTIQLHTNESSAVALATNAELEDFPFIEVDGKDDENKEIIPLKRFSIRSFNLDTYIEL